MVDQGILKYIKEGQSRGFSTSVLKKKLIEGGFKGKDIDEAISSLPTKIAKPAQAPQKANIPQNIPQKNQESLGIFSKIGKSIAHPVELFNITKGEGIWPVLKYHLVTLIVSFIFTTILAITLLNYISSFLIQGTYLNLSTLGIPIIMGVIALATFILIPISGFILVAIIHLFIKLYKGQGTYKDTYRAFIYGSTPTALFGWIPILNAAIGIWTFILHLYGFSINHSITKWRAFFALITPIIILIIIQLVVVFFFLT